MSIVEGVGLNQNNQSTTHNFIDPQGMEDIGKAAENDTCFQIGTIYADLGKTPYSNPQLDGTKKY